MNAGLIFALVCAVLAIVYGVWQIQRILRLPEGNEVPVDAKLGGDLGFVPVSRLKQAPPALRDASETREINGREYDDDERRAQPAFHRRVVRALPRAGGRPHRTRPAGPAGLNVVHVKPRSLSTY